MEQLGKTSTLLFNRHIRYNHSEKGCARMKRFDLSQKGIECRERFYATHGGKKAYQMERHYRLQEEAGCHIGVGVFYPGFRLLKALTNAPVVEI